MKRTVIVRRRLLASVLPLAAVLLVAGEALTPKGLDRPLSSLARATKEISIAEAHPGSLYLSNLLVIFGLGTLGVSFAAIAMLVRERGSTIATTAAVIGGLGGFCGALVNTFIGYDLASAATAHTGRAGAEQVLLSANRGWVFTALIVAYLGGVIVATLLTGVALWRSRAVARWLPVLFVVGVALAASAPAGVVSIPLQLPIAVALTALAVRIWGATASPSVLLDR